MLVRFDAVKDADMDAYSCVEGSVSASEYNEQGMRREFGATTDELLKLSDWLVSAGCEMAAMESTASYWKPLYNVLEYSGLNAMVVNAQHMRAVPGRKTDVKDAEWIADLLQHGLLKASYIPSKDQRELRELVRYRYSEWSARRFSYNPKISQFRSLLSSFC